jgi:DNA-binding response OmpR family regulator
MYQQLGEDANGTETVLLVEPDHQLRRVIAVSLEQKGLRVLQASDTGFAIRLLEREDPELLILDLKPCAGTDRLVQAYLDDENDENLAQRNRPILVTTLERPDKSWLQEFKPDAVIYKPFDVRYLYRRVMESLQE